MATIRTPDFIVIGAARSGTGTLYRLFCQHPQISMSVKKETHFFSNDANFAKGIEFYHTFFEDSDSSQVVGEATPAYSSRTENPYTAKRIYETLPKVKLIYIVRHPLQRIESFWRAMFVKNPHLKFNEFVHDKDFNPWHLDRSRYLFQISAYLDYFPDEQLLVVFYEDFQRDTQGTLKKCFEFIGVDPEVEISDICKYHTPQPQSTIELKSSFNFIRKLPGYGRIRDMFPGQVREKVVTSTGFKKEVAVPSPDWTPDTLKWMIDKLGEEAREFLHYYNKPLDFWPFDA